VPRPPSTAPSGADGRPRLRLAGLAAGVGGALAIVLLAGTPSAERVRDWVDGAGAVAPVAFVLLSAALTCALFPGPLLAGASGLLFGTALGTPLSLTAATLGACAAFSISRWVAGDAVVHVAGPRVLGLREWVGRRGFVSVLYARIAPGVPYTLVNYAAGLTSIRLPVFAAATAVGAAPRAYAYTALGGSFGDFTSPEAITAGAVLLAMALAGLALIRRDLRSGRGPSGPPPGRPAPSAGPPPPTRSGT
jgi:uncharacterized membrane protein YdjX (TVP38/TMEM64 family)